MIESTPTQKGGSLVFVWTQPRLENLGAVLRAAFEHPWVETYQVGFGPPLIKSSMRLERELAHVSSALDKLMSYLSVCFYDEEEGRRLAQVHRRLVVKRSGPVEAEVVRNASSQVLDLSFRLHPFLKAPPPVRAHMEAVGVTTDSIDGDLAPAVRAARFHVYLSDPHNQRLLHVDKVREAAGEGAKLAVELRVPVVLRTLFSAWAPTVPLPGAGALVVLDAPPSAARVVRDGQRH